MMKNKYLFGKFLFLLLITVFFVNDAQAWKYKEHTYITYKAYEDACKSIETKLAEGVTNEQITTFNKLCGNPMVQFCFSHMVGLAGDWVKDEQRLSKQNGKYLKSGKKYFKKVKKNIDCTDLLKKDNANASPFSANNHLTIQPDSPHLEYVLTNSKFLAFLGWLNLVSDNSNHFQPMSIDHWSEWHESSVNLHTDKGELHNVLIHKAFSLHYFQDSFSAGHNGLNRSLRRHNYDQAYHDGFNHTGMLLETKEGAMFYVYGDNKLQEKTIYLKLSDSSWTTIDLAINQLNQKLANNILIPSNDFIQKVSDKISDSNDGIFILSLLNKSNKKKADSLRCMLFDECNKQEIVILNKIDFVESVCTNDQIEKFNDFEISICNTSEKLLIQQTKLSLEAFLTHVILEDETTAEGMIARIKQTLPKSAYPIIKTVATSQTLNNSSHLYNISSNPNDLLTKYKEEELKCKEEKLKCKEKEFEEYKFLTYGLSHETRLEGDNIIPASSLGLILRGPITRYISGRIENRYQLYNENGKFFNSFDLSLFTPSKRVGRDLIGVYAKGSVGLDNIWEGSKRSRYAGLGLGLDAHFGSTTTFVEFDYLRHWGDRIADNYSVRVMVGVRVSTLKMGELWRN